MIMFISGSHFLNSLAQFDKVDRGTTTRKGPRIFWAFCGNSKNINQIWALVQFSVLAKGKARHEHITTCKKPSIETDWTVFPRPISSASMTLVSFLQLHRKIKYKHKYETPNETHPKVQFNFNLTKKYLLTRKFKPSSW